MDRATRTRVPTQSKLARGGVALARHFRSAPTESEDALWQAIRNRALGTKFRRQQVIGPFVVDFFAPDSGLIIEVDGPIHDDQIEADRERQATLESCGYRVLRVTATAVLADLPGVLGAIQRALILPPSLLDGEGGQGGEDPCET